MNKNYNVIKGEKRILFLCSFMGVDLVSYLRKYCWKKWDIYGGGKILRVLKVKEMNMESVKERRRLEKYR